MPKFRKKPVVVEAVQIASPFAESPQWLLDAFASGFVRWRRVGDAEAGLTVRTLEGNHRGDLGDWLIRGIKGELYPCKPDIFAATYEPAE